MNNYPALHTNKKNLENYFKYIKQQIEYPCYLRGIKKFSWEIEIAEGVNWVEEYFEFNPESSYEDEELIDNLPSYTDIFNLIDFKETDQDYGILIRVERISDERKFTLPLAELEAIDKKSGNNRLLNDYSIWFINYQ